MKKRNEDDPDNLGGLGGMLPAEVLRLLNELLEQMHQAGHTNQGSIVLNIFKSGSQYVEHVGNQYFYGDADVKKGSVPSPSEVREQGAGRKKTEEHFADDTPLSALFRKSHHEELRKRIASWRPYLIGDDASVDDLAMTHFEFDRNRIYSNKVYRDLCELSVFGALQVSLSQLARYLVDHSNLSRSYATLYQQLKYYRCEYGQPVT
jgi:hypothetical protein